MKDERSAESVADPVAHDVCVVTTIHPPFDGRIYHREVRTYVDAGFRVALVCPWAAPAPPPPGITWVAVRPARSRVSRVLHSARVFFRALRVTTSSYHFHDLDFLPWAVLLKWISGVPVIYDCHENYPEEVLHNKLWIPAALRRPLSRMVRRGEDWGVRRLGHTIVVVPHLASRFAGLGVRAELVRNFPAWRPRPELPHERALVCTGSLSAPYGVFVLLDIARALRRRGGALPLILTDRFENARLREDVRRIVRDEALDVRVLPSVAPDDLDRILRLGCVGLSVEQDLPNMRMGYHAKLFEYMAFGLPIVASDIASNRALLEQAGAGVLVRPDDGEGFAAAALDLIGDASRMERQREAGFEAIRTTFNWSVEGARMVRFTGELIRRVDRLPRSA